MTVFRSLYSNKLTHISKKALPRQRCLKKCYRCALDDIMNNSRKFTAYGKNSTNYNLSSSSFKRQSSASRYTTTSSDYGLHHDHRQYTNSDLKKSSWERSPVSHSLLNKGCPPSSKSVTVKRTAANAKGTNSSVTAGRAGKNTTGQQSSVTKSSHPVTNKATTHQPTTGITKLSTDSVTTSKAAGYPATGANRGTIGGFPTVVDNTKTTSHLSNDVTTKAVNKEDHYNSRIDQGKHEDDKSVLPINQKTSPLTNTTTTTTTITTTTSTTTSVVNDASDSSGKSVTVRGSQSINNTTGKGKHQEPSTSNTQETLLDNKLTGGGNYSSDRPPYNTTLPYSTASNNDPYHHTMNKSYTSNGGSSVGSGYGNYERHNTKDVRAPTYSKKQVVRGLSNLGNTCFYNAVMQNLTVLIILYEKLKMLANSSGTRSYTIPGGDMNAEPLTVTVNTSSGYSSLTNKLYQFLNNYNTGNPNPSSLLDGIGYKNTRFRGRAQQDSHELFRTLLDGIRTEESELVKKAIDQKLGESMDGETKLMKKVYKRNITTKIDEVFGGKTCSIVICRECHHVSHITEPFLDLSLPIVDSQTGRSRQMRDDKLTTTFTGVCDLLAKQQGSNMPYPMVCERSHDGVCNIENCLSDYTDIEVMDDDNKFICSECNRRHQEQGQNSTTGKGGVVSDPILSLVSKLLLISKLPPVLVLHLKRFSIGYAITKNSRHVKFPLNLNMKKYCTKQCEGGYEYRLKGVVSHSGSLNFGHYIAYVCSDNQWYYASDSHVNTASTGSVLNCEAYMLFYERT